MGAAGAHIDWSMLYKQEVTGIKSVNKKTCSGMLNI